MYSIFTKPHCNVIGVSYKDERGIRDYCVSISYMICFAVLNVEMLRQHTHSINIQFGHHSMKGDTLLNSHGVNVNLYNFRTTLFNRPKGYLAQICRCHGYNP